MANSDTEVAIIGGGAAGIAAGRRLGMAAIDCLVVEARPRLGGRAWSVKDTAGNALDLGCGWLHSADRNPWVKVAEAQGRTHRQEHAAVGAPRIAGRLSARRSRRNLPRRKQAFFERLGKRGEGAGRSGVGLARAERPLEQSTQRHRHLYQRRRT